MRQILTLVLPLLLSLPAFAQPLELVTRKTGDDWPKFLGPTADSVSAEKGILTAWPKDGLKLVWRAKLDLGYGPPTVSRGQLYHFDARPDKERRTNLARLTCRNAETGKELWTFEYKTE